MKTYPCFLKYIMFALMMALLIGMCSCRGKTSEKPPIHFNPNMDNQPKYNAQQESEFFLNGASMRSPVEGTVAQSHFQEDSAYVYGKDNYGNFIKNFPIKLDMDIMNRGQERFNIFCSPCHGKTGNGQGIVIKRGFFPPPNFHDDKVIQFDNGYIFDVITNGVRNMPPYKYQISIKDRWAIVAYLRALQRSQHATIDDIPENERGKLGNP